MDHHDPSSTSPSSSPAPSTTMIPIPSHPNITLRPWTPSFAPSITVHANNRAVWLNLFDSFPSPYRLRDAEAYIATNVNGENWADVWDFVNDPAGNGKKTLQVTRKRSCHFAIVRRSLTVTAGQEEGEEILDAIGSIGLKPGRDIAFRTAELGYWLGEAYWGQGIVGAAVGALMAWAWEAFPALLRVYAMPLARNAGSAGVLRRNGFVFEGRMRAMAWKDGKCEDEDIWACLRLE